MPDFYVVQTRAQVPIFTADTPEEAGRAFVAGMGPGQYGVVVVPVEHVHGLLLQVTEAVPAQLAVAATSAPAPAAPDAPAPPADPEPTP